MESIYGYNQPKPQLLNTKYLSAGIVLSVITAILYVLQLILYFLGIEMGYNHTILFTGFNVLINIFWIALLAVSIPYLSNFNMQSSKALTYALIGVYLLSIVINIAFSVANTYMMETDNVEISTWINISNVAFMIFNLLLWAVCIGLAVTMISNKSDFVGGIRYIGIAYLVMVIGSVLIYFFEKVIFPNFYGIDGFIEIGIVIISVAHMILSLLILAGYAYVFMKARQYKMINN